jgi:hypothetical protein
MTIPGASKAIRYAKPASFMKSPLGRIDGVAATLETKDHFGGRGEVDPDHETAGAVF